MTLLCVHTLLIRIYYEEGILLIQKANSYTRFLKNSVLKIAHNAKWNSKDGEM